MVTRSDPDRRLWGQEVWRFGCHRPDNVGSVYIFDRAASDSGGPWMQTTRLVTPSTFDAMFGQNLDLSEDLLLVGAPYEAELAGASYLYRASPTGWELVKRLPGGASGILNAQIASGDVLGRVTLDGLTAVVAGSNWRRPSSPTPSRVCDIRRDPGEQCESAAECDRGHCVDGVCCRIANCTSDAGTPGTPDATPRDARAPETRDDGSADLVSNDLVAVADAGIAADAEAPATPPPTRRRTP